MNRWLHISYNTHIFLFMTLSIHCTAFSVGGGGGGGSGGGGDYSAVSYWSESSDKELMIPPHVRYVF